jgi:hypothetical protein
MWGRSGALFLEPDGQLLIVEPQSRRGLIEGLVHPEQVLLFRGR